MFTYYLKRSWQAAKHPVRSARSLLHYGNSALRYVFMVCKYVNLSFVALLQKKGTAPQVINALQNEDTTSVDSFWNVHTVIGPELALVKTAKQSKDYLDWRFSVYPLFREFMQLWGNHDNEVILDYGCGPGNDLVGFLVFTNARKVIGIDISQKALLFASRRIALHNIDPGRVDLICISDSVATIPLDDGSIDYVYSEGVLHHTSNPEDIIRELFRVLKPGGRACIMVYNCDSIWLHLYVAYEQVILEKRFSGMDIYEAFARTTDTSECPIARCYRPDEFSKMCQKVGFRTAYVGGYFSNLELEMIKKYKAEALCENKLGQEHKDFLNALEIDDRGFPRYHGKHAGIGGVYNLYKH